VTAGKGTEHGERKENGAGHCCSMLENRGKAKPTSDKIGGTAPNYDRSDKETLKKKVNDQEKSEVPGDVEL